MSRLAWFALVVPLAGCGSGETKCFVECPADSVVDSTGCRCISTNPEGGIADAGHIIGRAEIIDGAPVLNGCPDDSGFLVDMDHAGSPPTGTCEPDTTCTAVTAVR